MEKRGFTVFSLRVAGELMIRGNKIIEIAKDRRNPDRDVYYFQNTDKVREDINEITKNHRLSQ